MVQLNTAHVIRAEDSNGAAVSGAKLYVYAEVSTTAIATYSDSALTSLNTHPVVADSAGDFGPVYLPAGNYKIDVTTSAGTSLPGYPVDNIALGGAAVAEHYDTKVAIEGASIAAVVNYLRTAGYATVGDGGAALYKRVGSEPSRALKVQSADLAWWELVPDAPGLNILQAGADPTGSADSASAIQDCIDFLGEDNGKLLLPRGTYKTLSMIRVEDNIAFEGEGYGTMTIGRSTVVSVASGVTGFIVQRRGSTGGDNYGDNASFRNMEIDAVGKNTTTTTGTISAASNTLTLAAAEDFADGDIISIRGANETQTLMNALYLTAATTAASDEVTLSQLAGIYDGMVLSVAGANFPAGAYIVSKSGVDVVMSEVAGNTVTAGKITYYNDLVVQVLSGGGTTTLTTNEKAYTSVTDAEVLHYDCGIYAQSRLSIERCMVRDFQGAGLMIHAGGDVDNEHSIATNANSWNIRDSRFSGCRNGLRFKGNDANAGSAIGVDMGSNDEYGLVDASFLGNYYFGCHVSGGKGYMVVFLNAWSTFDACYVEGGTKNSFAQRTLVHGGAMHASNSNVAGGNAATVDSNVIYQSATNFYPNWHDYSLIIGNQSPATNGIFQAEGRDGGPNIRFVRTTSAGHGQDGLWGWMEDGDDSKCGLYISDSDSDHGSGRAFFLNGYYLGKDQANVTQSNFRRVLGGTAAPVAGTWVKGDRIENQNAVAGDPSDWKCTVGGTPGTWVEMRGIADQTSDADQAAITNSTGGTADKTMLAVPAGGTGAAAGGWDTAANRNLAITAINKNITELHELLDQVRTTLVDNGMMKGSA